MRLRRERLVCPDPGRRRHSGGLQAIDISVPWRPTQAGWFSPTPLASVATEDPALSSSDTSGRHDGEVKHIRFLEGN